MKADLLIKNCSVLTPDFEIKNNQSIAIQGNEIKEIGNQEDINNKYQPEEVINGNGKLSMPGLIDCHVHICQQLLRGRTADEFPMVWARIIVPFESNLTEDDSYVSGELCALEMIKSGTTAFAESGGRHMQAVIRAIDKSGLRAMIARSVMDQAEFIPNIMKDSTENSIKKTEELYKKFNNIGDGRIKIWFALRQILTCSTELISLTAEKAKEYSTGVHIHLAEHRDEVSYCLQNFKKRPAEYLNSLGFLGSNVIAAHSIMLTDSEIDLLSEKGVSAVCCPRSNLSNHGFPKTPTMLNAGVNIGLGTDGAHSSKMDLFEQMKILRSAISAFYGIPIFDPVSLPAKKLLKMVTQGGAKAIGMGDKLGKLSEGYLADISLINIDQPHLSPTHNLINTLVDAASGSDVWDLIVDGKIIMQNRKVLTLDEEKIIYKAKKHMNEIKKRASI